MQEGWNALSKTRFDSRLTVYDVVKLVLMLKAGQLSTILKAKKKKIQNE